VNPMSGTIRPDILISLLDDGKGFGHTDLVTV
jgi:hypothetical protein